MKGQRSENENEKRRMRTSPFISPSTKMSYSDSDTTSAVRNVSERVVEDKGKAKESKSSSVRLLFERMSLFCAFKSPVLVCILAHLSHLTFLFLHSEQVRAFLGLF